MEKTLRKVVSFMVLSLVLGTCGGGGGGGSSNSSIGNEISPAISAGVTYYNTLVSSGVDKKIAVDNTINFFKNQGDILDAYPAADGINIFIEQNNGITTFFITNFISDNSSLSATEFINVKTINMASSYLASSSNSFKAIILDPFNFPVKNSSSVNNILSGFPGAEVRYLKGSDVTPEIFQNLSGNDLIYYFGHGGVDSKNGGVVAIGTGVAYSDEIFKSYLSKYNDSKEINNGRYKYFIHAVALGGDGKKIEYIFINSKFIEDYSKGLNATAVYIDACHSLDSDDNATMANAFMNNGANSYLGWSGVEYFYQPDFDWSLTANVAESFFNDILACKNVVAAFNNLPFDYNQADLHYRGDGMLPMCIPETNMPGAISVDPASGSWNSSPQNLAVSSSNATTIHYTMVNTYDGSTPEDPREPTSSDNDGSITVSSGAGTFELYASAGEYKQSKVRFRGYNSAGAGAASEVYSYTINLSTVPGSISVNPSSGNWTSTPQNLSVSSSNSMIIYYTMVNTYDGSTPADPREPTSSDNDGFIINLSDGVGTFQLYATTCQVKQSKLRFRGYNSAGAAGVASGVYSYSINLLPPIPGSISVDPASGSWTSSHHVLAVTSSNATEIYFTMVNTYDGSTPADPRDPTSSDNDGSINGPYGYSYSFYLEATAGQNKRSKLKFRGYNCAGAGPASGVYSYSINMSWGEVVP